MMKTSRILLFLLSVLMLLGAISWKFPDEGLRVGNARIKFPSRAAINENLFTRDTVVPVLSPEELMALHIKEVKNHETEVFFSDYLSNSISRLYFPDDDPSMLDSVFDAFDSASVRPVRIAHYGDSQLEEDRITYSYRRKLQERFGGSGVGMVPLMILHATLSMRQTHSDTLRRTMVYGAKNFSVVEGKYGPMGQASRVYSYFSATFMPTKKADIDNPSRYFSKVTILSDTLGGILSVKSGEQKGVLDKSGSAMHRTCLHFPDSTEAAGLSFAGHTDVYGVMFDGESGISVDNIAMRGCSGTVFSGMNRNQLKDYFNNSNVRLIILQFGGNSIPYRKNGNSISEYSQKIYEQIRYLANLAPDAKFIFIGPSDMARYSDGKVRSFENLPMMVDSLRHYSNKAGAAYWDLRQVMGGEGSMVKWAETGYAGKDYIHFTQKGAEYVGDVLYETLSTYYDYYKWCNAQEE